ncbi:SusC/RagA family TonB-linked outer membrane protein [Halalkalibaculum sp. DA3122]|uniref:SusC/RagA family TonB-linked outer membrane protein n=1 Tax=unclassified Halalkalibaculum TaxID=2964617 RepID=UPI00375495D7
MGKLYKCSFYLLFITLLGIATAVSAQQKLADYNEQQENRNIALQTVPDQLLEMRISLNVEEMPVRQVLNRIQKKVGAQIVYTEDLMAGDLHVTLHAEKQKVFDILDQIGYQTGLKYWATGSFIIMRGSELPKQMETVSGQVTDAASGDPLPGVNVVVKGTTTGTSTDSEGGFELGVPSLQDTLVFSFIGYQTQEVPINGRTNIDVALQTQAVAGEELVVVGYGTQQEQDVTGSVESVTMEKVSEQVVTGGDELLAGQVSGVNVNQPAGIPGGGPTIEIRGIGAVGAGSQPLYVIDGFPISGSSSVVSNPLSNIPAEDIESITVLKDASATAIYGSRGANGVIMIETKKGTSGQMQVQISAYTGWQQVRQQEKPDLMNARQFAQFQKERISDQIRFQENREPTMDDIPEEYRNPEQYGEGTDWYDEVTRMAPMQNLRFNISGGSDNIQSYISGAFLTQEGVVLGTDYQRFSLRANVNATISDKLSAGINLAPTFSNRAQVAIGGAGRGEPGFGTALVASPLEPVYNEDGSFNEMIGNTGTFNYPNPVLESQDIKNDSRTFNGLLNGYVEYNLLDELRFKTSANVEFSDGQVETFHPSNVGNLFQPPPVIPSGSFIASSGLNWATENTLTYQDEFLGSHSIEALLGFSVQQDRTTGANINGQDFADDEIKTLNAASRLLGGTNKQDWSLVSYLARMNYDYQNKYLITATVRQDGSSRFGSDNRWGVFPSGALGWRISEEPFMEELSWISELKLRGSYGITGNYNIGNYTHLSQIGTSDYVLGNSRASGRILNQLGNPNLGWERTSEINFGLDLGLWEDRVTLHAEYYVRNTEDLLLNVEIPQSSGFSNVTENRGDVENRGLELSINSNNISQQKLSWSTDFNIAFNRNKVLELGRDNAPIFAGFGGGGLESNITKVGEPIGMFYGWVIEGIFQSEEEIANSPSYQGAVPGNLKMKDVNGDGVLSEPHDFAIIGNPYPDFTWGMTNSLQLNNFDLRVLLTGSYGGERYREDHHYYHNIDGVFNVSTDVQDRWKSPEEPGNGEVPGTVGLRNRQFFRHINTGAIEDNSHIWVKNVTLGYTLGEELMDGIMQSARVYVSVQNALLLTNYGGSNPEATNYNNASGDGNLAPGLDFVSYPLPRVTTLGIKLNL